MTAPLGIEPERTYDEETWLPSTDYPEVTLDWADERLLIGDVTLGSDAVTLVCWPLGSLRVRYAYDGAGACSRTPSATALTSPDCLMMEGQITCPVL